MKRLSLFYVSLFASHCIYSQSHLLKAGTLKPYNDKAITILPTTKHEGAAAISLVQPSTKKIVLVGGSMNPSVRGNEILTNSFKNNGLPGLLDNNSRTKSNTNSTTTPKNSFNNTNIGYDFLPLTDGNSLTTKSISNNQIQTTPLSLEPLTYSPSVNNTNKQAPVETLDPSKFNSNKSVAQQVVPNKNRPVYVSSIKAKQLETVGPRTQGSSNQIKMIELLPIIQDNVRTANNSSTSTTTIKNNSGMPDLAPIEGVEIKSLSQKSAPTSSMPDLAPLESENNVQQQQQQLEPIPEIEVKDNKTSTKLRGFTVPKGTLLKANETRTYILKPSVPQKPTQEEDNLQYAKPSAGGGMGLMLLDEVENNSPSLNKNFQTNQQLQQAAKNHQHDPNNPCCKVQMMKTTAKPAVKKRTYKRKRRYYYQPTPVVRSYKQDPVQSQNTERIVYVPMQTGQTTAQETNKKQVVQEVYNAPVQQRAASQQKDRVIYKDYTNTYAKQLPPQTVPCNCPNTQQSVASKGPKAFYNQNNYANGLNAGPTSGDYPISGKTSDANMQYTFYVNPRGKYGLSLYNNYCSILLSQNGKVVEFKELSDPNSPPPKLTYFGSPESIGGIPIEYNYNRSVHKIGNIVMDYDFEGFFKTVGGSNVSYTSRSSLAKVDNVNVRYDQSGNVTSVDNNNGLIQYNP